jgi:hypothetical protein
MLILTRKIGEGLMIRDDISIVILGVRGQQIRLGIEAPADIPCSGPNYTDNSWRKIPGLLPHRCLSCRSLRDF